MSQGKRSEPIELFTVIVLGILLRLFAGRNSFSESGILLPGYDEYYHMRRILFTANHFPNTLWFDSYLNYPHGFDITWPPLFDQLSAALCVAFGQHARAGAEMIASFVPIIIGIIAIAAVYYIIRELFDHKTALLASFMAALAPYYLLYTMFAALDHHCLEVLLSLTILLFLIKAFIHTEKKYLYAAAAGVAMAALAYTWEGADIYLGIFLMYAAIQMALDLKGGRSSDETGKLMLVAFAVAFVLQIPFGNSVWLSASFRGTGAMLFVLGLMFVLSRVIIKRNMAWKAFPLSLAALLAIFVLATKLTGGLFGIGSLIQSGMEYIWGGGMIGKIGEAEPLIYDAETFSEVAFSMLGLNLLLSIGGTAAAISYIIRSTGALQKGRIMFFVWTLFTIILTIGQSRFLYISTISIGLLISILFFFLLEWAGSKNNEGDLENKNLKGEQKASTRPMRSLTAILLLILVIPTAWDAASFAQNTPPAVAGDFAESLAWLKENSNVTSFYDSPQEKPEYSVMSWWDYGNWVLYLSERPVVANNFQAGVVDAAKFYLSESEDDATAILDKRGSRYVLTDYSMIYGKFSALTNWINEDLGSYMSAEDQGSQYAIMPRERLFNTTLAKLYLFDGAGTGHFRLAYESKTFLGESPAKSNVKIFEYVPGALIKIRAKPDQKAGALLNMTSNQGRPFTYVNEAKTSGDTFLIRVPYSTENRNGCHAVTPYLVFSGNKNELKTLNLNVSEEDVIKGKTIELTL